MELVKAIVEGICGAALFINALLFVLQALKLFKSKSTQGISFITFLGFLFIQLFVVLHGIIQRDPILIMGYSLSMIACGVVVILLYCYRKNAYDNENLIERLESIISGLPGHLYWTNRDGIYQGCNDNQARSAGLSCRQDIKGKRNKDLPWNFNAGTLPEALDQINQEVMKTGKPLIVEEPAILKDGSQLVFLSYKLPLRNKKGDITGMAGISIDITDKKKIEAELSLIKNKVRAANRANTVLENMRHDIQIPISNNTTKFLEILENDLDYQSDAEALVEILKSVNLEHCPLDAVYRCLWVLSDLIGKSKNLNEDLLNAVSNVSRELSVNTT